MTSVIATAKVRLATFLHMISISAHDFNFCYVPAHDLDTFCSAHSPLQIFSLLKVKQTTHIYVIDFAYLCGISMYFCSWWLLWWL